MGFEIPMIRMFQKMHLQFVNRSEAFRANLTFVFSFAMVCSNMFTNNGIFHKYSLAVGTAKGTIFFFMSFNVIFQCDTLAK